MPPARDPLPLILASYGGDTPNMIASVESARSLLAFVGYVRVLSTRSSVAWFDDEFES